MNFKTWIFPWKCEKMWFQIFFPRRIIVKFDQRVPLWWQGWWERQRWLYSSLAIFGSHVEIIRLEIVVNLSFESKIRKIIQVHWIYYQWWRCHLNTCFFLTSEGVSVSEAMHTLSVTTDYLIQYKIQYSIVQYNTNQHIEIGQDKPRKEKEPKRRHTNQRHTHLYSQESHKNIKLGSHNLCAENMVQTGTGSVHAAYISL